VAAGHPNDNLRLPSATERVEFGVTAYPSTPPVPGLPIAPSLPAPPPPASDPLLGLPGPDDFE
jgi:hypothetical protein